MRPDPDGGGGGNSAKGLGMDPVRGKQQAGQLDEASTKIKKAQSDIDSAMGELKAVWFGDDANRYQSKWNSDYKAQLTQASKRLHAAAVQVRHEAAQQTKTSN